MGAACNCMASRFHSVQALCRGCPGHLQHCSMAICACVVGAAGPPCCWVHLHKSIQMCLSTPWYKLLPSINVVQSPVRLSTLSVHSQPPKLPPVQISTFWYILEDISTHLVPTWGHSVWSTVECPRKSIGGCHNWCHFCLSCTYVCACSCVFMLGYR